MVREIKLKGLVNIDTDASDQEIKDWIMYELGISGSISALNPLIKEGCSIDFSNIDFELK